MSPPPLLPSAAAAPLTRRGVVLGGLAALGAAACAGGAGAPKGGGGTSGGDGGDGGPDTSAGADGADGGDTGAPAPWATGGTAGLTVLDAAPFSAPGAACALTCPLMLGPCYHTSPERRDISEGTAGLPVRLLLRVVDAACAPLAGMVVDVWHAAPSGRYSGDEGAAMCTGGDAEAMASTRFRGFQRTGADGVAELHTCLPGWYPGRAVHLHVQVRTGDAEGVGAHLTTQLFFPGDVVADVYARHPDYAPRGQPDTSLAEDGPLAGEDPAPWTTAAARQSDGSLLVWGTMAVRAPDGTAVCP